jgi:Tfp pilus assembly protein PilX
MGNLDQWSLPIKKRLLSLKSSDNRTNKQSGLILITVMVAVSAITIVGIAVLSSATSQYVLTKNDTYNANALYTAEAGIEESIQQLNASGSFGGYSINQSFFSNTSQGYGVYTTAVTTSGSAKIITATGSVYSDSGLTRLVSTRKVQAIVVPQGGGVYAVQTGPGGLNLSGTATLSGGPIYVNGQISMNQDSAIGSAGTPLNVYVANLGCSTGFGPTLQYPVICGSQPINLQQDAIIYGSVCAPGQTTTNFAGSGSPNAYIQGPLNPPGCMASPISLPTYNEAAQKSAVTTTGSGSSNTYNCISNVGPYTRTWAANLELTGAVNVNGSCNITINGNVYITGDLTLSQNSQITVSNSVGTTRPVVIVDGTITVQQGVTLQPNSAQTSVKFISFQSCSSGFLPNNCNPSCNPDCTSLTPTQLKTSQSIQTVNISGTSNMLGAVFDAYWGTISVSQDANIGQAIGQTVNLSQGGNLSFNPGLGGSPGAWSIANYQQVFH